MIASVAPCFAGTIGAPRAGSPFAGEAATREHLNAINLVWTGGQLLSETPIAIADGDVSVVVAPEALRMSGPADRRDLRSTAFHIWQKCRGNLLLATEDRRSLLLASHPSGVFPLFYRAGSEHLRFSAKLMDLLDDGAPAPDWAGVAGVLLYGYSLNGRTVAADVKRLQPGQAISCRLVEGQLRVEIQELSQLWSARPDERIEEPDASAIDDIWEMLVAAVGLGLDDRRATLMMSGGWDSRTLLAALTTALPPDRVLAYSHGDVKSRELRLVQKIANAAGCPSFLQALTGDAFSPDAVRGLLENVGDGFFPHWYRSGQILKQMSSGTASSGVLGEVLGGHYGQSMVTSGHRKIAAVAAYALGLSTAWNRLAKADPHSLLSRGISQRRPWFIDSEAWPTLSRGYDEIQSDVDATISRLHTRGIRSPEGIIECAITELRGAQYIAAQPRSLAPHVPISIPFADLRLLSKLTQLPMAYRIHNSLNRRLLMRFRPDLLRLPTAATLVRASSPILAQEAGRAVRKLIFSAHERAYSRFGYPSRLQPRYSWVDYEFLRDGTELEGVVRSLKAAIWDRPALLYAIQRARQPNGPSSMHSLTDMALKIRTIDFHLAAAEWPSPSPEGLPLETT